MKPNKKTELHGLIGSPVEHSLSPFIHSYFAEYTGNSTAYAAFSVGESNLSDAVKGAYALGIKGLNITMPYKQAVIPLLYELDESAKRINAVNTIKHTKNGYVGYNTDISGFVMTLEKHGAHIKDRSVVIFGAGGSAASAAFAAASLGAAEIIIVNRTISNANKLAERIKKYYNIPVVCDIFENLPKVTQYAPGRSVSYKNPSCSYMTPARPCIPGKKSFILVQATAVGLSAPNERCPALHPEFSEFQEKYPVTDMRVFEGAEYAIDFIYSPYETAFLKMAKDAGCKAVNGIDILIFQAAAAYEIWTGTKIPSECTDYLSRELAQ